MKSYLRNCLLSLFSIFMVSCVSLSQEEQRFAEVKQIKEFKSPAKAASLSLLPGVGTLYLASAKDRPSQQQDDTLGGTAMLNWATWPVSILWAVPQAYIDAKKINIKEAYAQEKLHSAR